MDLISAAAVASMLKVSERQVRRLAACGELPSKRVGDRWLFDAEEIRQASKIGRRPGRPLSAPMAWAVVEAACASILPAAAPMAGAALAALLSDRRIRHRLNRLLEDAPPVDYWDSWLRRRAHDQRVWVHPGVLDRLDSDPRLHASNPAVFASIGLGSVHEQQQRYYVYADDVDGVIRDYHAQNADDGQVLLRIVPPDAPAEVLGVPGDPAPAAAMLVDLLVSSDARERHAARSALEHVRLDRTLVATTGALVP